MDIKIGNQLIADKLGFSETNHGFEDTKGILIDVCEKDTFKLTELLFHTDWNWLMEAVKIASKVATEELQTELKNALLTYHRNEVWMAVIHIFQKTK